MISETGVIEHTTTSLVAPNATNFLLAQYPDSNLSGQRCTETVVVVFNLFSYRTVLICVVPLKKPPKLTSKRQTLPFASAETI